MFGFGKPAPPPNGCHYYGSREELSKERVESLEAIAYRWGETYDAYLVNEGRREYFWLPDHSGVVSFTRWGRHGQVVGGLLAPPERRAELLENCLKYARQRRWTLSFYNVAREHTKLFEQQGCEISKLGEEPLIQLDRTEWRGKPYEWVRRQENYCNRQGVEVEELAADTDDPVYRDEIAPELLEVSHLHLKDTLHARELKFFVGSFDPLHLQHRRLFVARFEGQIVAFVVCNPCLQGEMWAVEIYRKRPDAPRGVVPHVIMHALRKLKSEQVVYASLSLIPLLRCDTQLHKGNWLFYLIANTWWNRLNWIFDMRGIYHFKSRFRPEYREMFLAAYPKVSIGSMIAMGMTWEVIKFNPFRLLRRGIGKLRTNRNTMAEPSWRPERVVRSLKTGAKKKTKTIPKTAPATTTAAADPGTELTTKPARASDPAHATPPAPKRSQDRRSSASEPPTAAVDAPLAPQARRA